MTATSAFASTVRRRTTVTRNRHITTAIVVALYALLVVSAVWLAVVQPEPPRLPAQTPRSAAASTAPHLGAAAGPLTAPATNERPVNEHPAQPR